MIVCDCDADVGVGRTEPYVSLKLGNGLLRADCTTRGGG